jgi:hypothetical protein
MYIYIYIHTRVCVCVCSYVQGTVHGSIKYVHVSVGVHV